MFFHYFRDTIWVILTVEPSGTLSITQQFNNLSQLGRVITYPSRAGHLSSLEFLNI